MVIAELDFPENGGWRSWSGEPQTLVVAARSPGDFPENGCFRDSSRRKAFKTRGFGLLNEGFRASFSGKSPALGAKWHSVVASLNEVLRRGSWGESFPADLKNTFGVEMTPEKEVNTYPDLLKALLAPRITAEPAAPNGAEPQSGPTDRIEPGSWVVEPGAPDEDHAGRLRGP